MPDRLSFPLSSAGPSVVPLVSSPGPAAAGAAARPSMLAGQALPRSPGEARAEGTRSLASQNVALRQVTSAALGAAAVLRTVVAVGTLGISEGIAWAAGKGLERIGTRPAPPDGVSVTMPGSGRVRLEGQTPVVVRLPASALPARIPAGMTDAEFQARIQAKVESGQRLADALLNDTHDGRPCTNEDVSGLAFFLHARAGAAHEGFREGAFSVEDPGGRIRRFLDSNPAAYQRESSHLGSFQGREGGRHRGIDCTTDGDGLTGVLPGGKKAILYGSLPGGVDGGTGVNDRLFLSLESHGAYLTRPRDGGDAHGPRRFGNLHDVGAILGHTFSGLLPGGRASSGVHSERVPDEVRNGYAALQPKVPTGPLRALLDRGAPLGPDAGIHVMLANVDAALAAVGPDQPATEAALRAFRDGVLGRTDEAGRPRYDHPELRIGDEIIFQQQDLQTDRRLEGELTALHGAAAEFGPSAGAVPVGADLTALRTDLGRFQDLMALTSQQEQFRDKVSHDEPSAELNGLRQATEQTKDQIRLLADRINSSVGVLVAAAVATDGAGTEVRPLAGRLGELRELERVLSDDGAAVVGRAPRSDLSAAIRQVETLQGLDQRRSDLDGRIDGWGPAGAETLPVAFQLAADLVTLGTDLGAFEPGDRPALVAERAQLQAQVQRRQEGFPGQVNAAVLRAVDDVVTPPSSADTRASLEGQVRELQTLRTALGADVAGVITEPTRVHLDAALADLQGRIGRLTERMTGTADQARQAIDGAEPYLRNGGGLTTLTPAEVPGAVTALRRLDGLLRAPAAEVGSHLSALQKTRDQLSGRIAAVVGQHVSPADPLSPAAVLGKLKLLYGLGLPEARAALRELPLKEITGTFLRECAGAVASSVHRADARAGARLGELADRVGPGGSGGVVPSAREALAEARAAQAKAGELVRLAKAVKAAVTGGEFTDAAKAIDDFIAKADPALQDDLRMITAQFAGSLRAAVESLPGQLSAEAESAARLKAYETLKQLERALPADQPDEVRALRSRVIQAMTEAYPGVEEAIEAARTKALEAAVGLADAGRRAAALVDLLAQVTGLASDDDPAVEASRAHADRVRTQVSAALGEQRTALEPRMAAAAAAVPSPEERRALTMELRSLVRNLDAWAAADPQAELAELRTAAAGLQRQEVRAQLGPKAREAVEAHIRAGGDGAEGRRTVIDAALTRLYGARALTQPAFTDRLEFLVGRPDSVRLLSDLANGDASLIDAYFNGPHWDSTALRLKLLALEPALRSGAAAAPASASVTREAIALDHALVGAKRSLDFALRAGNPGWRTEERERQLAGNRLGAGAGGMLNIRFDEASVQAFLRAGENLGRRADGSRAPGFDLPSFALTLALVVRLEGERSGAPSAETAGLLRRILTLDASVPDETVLAKALEGQSFRSADGMLKLADRLGDFADRMANSRNGKLLAAMVQYSKDAGDARPEAALLVDRISAQTLTRAQQAGAKGLGLEAGKKLYGRAWTTTVTQLSREERGALATSALLVQRLVTNQAVDPHFLDHVAARLARKPGLEGKVAGGTGVFSSYFGVGSEDFREVVNLTKVNAGAVRALQAYTAQPVTCGGATRSLRDHVDGLVAALGQRGFPERAAELLGALPAGKPMKGHFERLIGELVATKAAVLPDRANVNVARRRLEALCELGGRAPALDQHLAAERAARGAQSLLSRAAGVVTGNDRPAPLGGFPPTPEAAGPYRQWARSELSTLQRTAPDLMRMATAVMLEHFSESSYTSFGDFQRDLVGGADVRAGLTDGLGQDLARRLVAVGLANVSAATGATGGENQVVSLLRLSLFARPAAEEFLAEVAKGLPASDRLAAKAEGLLKAHLETYSHEATLLDAQVRRLLPGQTLEIEVTSTGSLRIKAPVGAPAVSATAGFSAARSNSVAVTREGNGFVVVCKTGTSGGLSAGVSVLGDRLSASLNAGGNVAAGTVLEFAPRRDSAGREEPPTARVGALLTGLFSQAGAKAPGEVLRSAAPDRMRCVDGRGAYVGVEASAKANAKLPGPLEAVSLTLEVDAGVSAEIAVTNETNSFQHRRTAQTSYAASLAGGVGVGSATVSAGASLTVKKEKTMVTELGVVSADSFIRTSVAVGVQAMGRRSEGDFDRMLDRLNLPEGLRGQMEGRLNLMRRQGPVAVAVRSQLTPEAVQQLATRGPGVSPDQILNAPGSYVLTALEFTVPGGESLDPVPEPEPEKKPAESADEGSVAPEPPADPDDLIGTSQERVAAAQEDLAAARERLEQAQAFVASQGAPAEEVVATARAQVAAAQARMAAAQQALAGQAGNLGSLASRAGSGLAQGQQVVADVAARAEGLASGAVSAGQEFLQEVAGSGLLDWTEAAMNVAADGLTVVQDALADLAGFSLSIKSESTGAMRASRVYTLDVSPEALAALGVV